MLSPLNSVELHYTRQCQALDKPLPQFRELHWRDANLWGKVENDRVPALELLSFNAKLQVNSLKQTRSSPVH